MGTTHEGRERNTEERECVRIRKRKEEREKGKVCVFLLVLWHGQAALQGFHVRIEIPKWRGGRKQRDQ